jgi:hypothetical protein
MRQKPGQTKSHDGSAIFADPVGYLASLGIAAELVDETALPTAA